MRRGAAACAWVVTWCLVLLPGRAAAQQGVFSGMQVGVESVFSSVMTTITFASGAVTKTASRNIYPQFTLNLNTMLYPNLRLSVGGVFELNEQTTTTGPFKTTSTITRNRPYFLLRSTNPILSPGVGYFRREGRSRAAGQPDVKLVNDEYAAYLGWRPEGGPVSDFQFLKTHAFDDNRTFQDLSKDFGSLVSNYKYRDFSLNYRGAYLKAQDQIEQLETREVTHGLRGDYAQSFFQKRLQWNTTYSANHQNLKTSVRGAGGEVALPVTPFAGLASISDTPATAPLSPNPQLIDSDLTGSAGIDLGLAATPADARLRNIGLDLLTPAEVSRFLVWVDRDLPVEIANAFSWEIYSSTDNLIWRREAAVPVAAFGTFENRFEIDFPGVTARYIKVVTRPLSSVVPDATRFQDIFVTEIQAFQRRPAEEISGTLSRGSSLFNTDVRMRILDVPSLYYEGFYLVNQNSGLSRTGTLSNGVSVTQDFGRIFSTSGRFAREQGTQAGGDRVSTITTATLTIEPMPTFRSSVLYSGQNEEVAGARGNRLGLFVQNSAQPYRGVDVLFGFGWTSATRDSGEISHDQLLNLSATITPRQRVSFTLSYDRRATQRSGIFVGSPQSLEHRSYASVAFDPVRTLRLTVGGEVIAGRDLTTRTTLDVGASWAPFPDGALQFVFAYDEAFRDLEFGKDLSTLGAVRWNVSRKSYVDVSYQRIRTRNSFLTTESRILSARVRLFL